MFFSFSCQHSSNGATWKRSKLRSFLVISQRLVGDGNQQMQSMRCDDTEEYLSLLCPPPIHIETNITNFPHYPALLDQTLSIGWSSPSFLWLCKEWWWLLLIFNDFPVLEMFFICIYYFQSSSLLSRRFLLCR